MLFAGLAEHLAMRDGQAAPAWSASRGLRRFWFPFDTPGARAQALVHAPAALSILNQPGKLIDRAEAALAEVPDLPLADQSLVLAQASLGRTFAGDLAGGEDTAGRALDAADRSGNTAMTVWSNDATKPQVAGSH